MARCRQKTVILPGLERHVFPKAEALATTTTARSDDDTSEKRKLGARVAKRTADRVRTNKQGQRPRT